MLVVCQGTPVRQPSAEPEDFRGMLRMHSTANELPPELPIAEDEEIVDPTAAATFISRETLVCTCIHRVCVCMCACARP